MNDRITVYVCRGCGRVAVVMAQLGSLTVECHTWGCCNWQQSKCTKGNIADWYTAVSVEIGLAARMIEIFETVG